MRATRVDAQAAYESQMSIWSSVLGGANLVYHGAGWMEGGLTASFEKLVIDVEMLQMMAVTLAPSDVTAEEISEGVDAIAGVRTGGHFFGAPHTLGRYESAFYEPLVSDWQSHESWSSPARRRPTSARPPSGRRRSTATSSRRSVRTSVSASTTTSPFAGSSSETPTSDERRVLTLGELLEGGSRASIDCSRQPGAYGDCCSW